MWNKAKHSTSDHENRDARETPLQQREARRLALVQEIESYLRGDQSHVISARELAAMINGIRLTTLRKSLLLNTCKAYRRGGRTRTSLLPGILTLIDL